MDVFRLPPSFFRVPLVEAGAFPRQQLLGAAYYMQIRPHVPWELWLYSFCRLWRQLSSKA